MAKTQVTVFEVGPRDGLQNEPRTLATADKIWLITELVKAGVREIEAGAFVRPDRVPQMADSAEVCKGLQTRDLKKARTWFLVPNYRGLEGALAAGAKNIAVFTAASDSFAKANIGMTVRESLAEFSEVLKVAKKKRLRVRGYVSTAFGCPFEGKVPPRRALTVVEKLIDLGVDQVSIGDTIGVATPNQVDQIVRPALRSFGKARVAVHFHDTRGTALANALRSLELGVRVIDSSAGGLGGCPYAPSATGNLATEDLLYMLHGMGIETGIDLEKVCATSLELAKRMGRPLSSKYLQAYAAKCSC